MYLVNLARFERATSTFAEPRSYSAELQVQTFSIANCRLPNCVREDGSSLIRAIADCQSQIGNGLAEMERFERSQDFSRHLSGVLPFQLGDISGLAEG